MQKTFNFYLNYIQLFLLFRTNSGSLHSIGYKFVPLILLSVCFTRAYLNRSIFQPIRHCPRDNVSSDWMIFHDFTILYFIIQFRCFCLITFFSRLFICSSQSKKLQRRSKKVRLNLSKLLVRLILCVPFELVISRANMHPWNIFFTFSHSLSIRLRCLSGLYNFILTKKEEKIKKAPDGFFSYIPKYSRVKLTGLELHMYTQRQHTEQLKIRRKKKQKQNRRDRARFSLISRRTHSLLAAISLAV